MSAFSKHFLATYVSPCEKSAYFYLPAFIRLFSWSLVQEILVSLYILVIDPLIEL